MYMQVPRGKKLLNALKVGLQVVTGECEPLDMDPNLLYPIQILSITFLSVHDLCLSHQSEKSLSRQYPQTAPGHNINNHAYKTSEI